MRYEYIEPFVSSTVKVLDNVMQSDITKGELSLVSGVNILDDIAIVVKIKGDSHGSIILNMEADTALRISSMMFGEEIGDLDPMGMDSLSELANMIAGKATSVLNDMGFDFKVLPPVVLTKQNMFEKIPELEVFQIPLFTEYGEININVAMNMNL